MPECTNACIKVFVKGVQAHVCTHLCVCKGGWPKKAARRQTVSPPHPPGSSLCMREMQSVSAKEVWGNMAPSSAALLTVDDWGGGAARVEDRVTASFKIFWASFQWTPCPEHPHQSSHSAHQQKSDPKRLLMNTPPLDQHSKGCHTVHQTDKKQRLNGVCICICTYIQACVL